MVDKGERPQHHSAEYRRAEYLHFWHSAAVVLRVATQKLLHGCLSKKDRCHLVHLILPPLSHTCTFQLGLQAPVCCKKKKKREGKNWFPEKDPNSFLRRAPGVSMSMTHSQYHFMMFFLLGLSFSSPVFSPVHTLPHSVLLAQRSLGLRLPDASGT